MPRLGSDRLLWMSALSALSGDTYTTRTSSGKRRAQTFLQQIVEGGQECGERLAGPGRRAMSVCRRVRIEVHPRSCAAVGVPMVSANHRAVTGWKGERDMGQTRGDY